MISCDMTQQVRKKQHYSSIPGNEIDEGKGSYSAADLYYSSLARIELSGLNSPAS